MSEKAEKLNSALDHTRHAMREIDEVMITRMRKHTLGTIEFESLDDVYRTLKQAEQKISELKV